MNGNILKIGYYISLIILAIYIGTILFAIPATLTLPKGIRPGIDKITIEETIKKLGNSEKGNFENVEEVRKIVSKRMKYCRRNGFDSYETAFYRGYGYCAQQAYAMEYILKKLGYNAKVVQAVRNKFSNGDIGGHAWVRVVIDGEARDFDPSDSSDSSEENAQMKFQPLSSVTDIGPVFKALMLWGSPAVNAYRFYITGKDL